MDILLINGYTFRLMSGQEYFKEDVKQRLEKKEAKAKCTIKGEKLLTMSFKIGENDLKIKMNHLVKWLNKSYEVRIVIEGDSANKEASVRYSNVKLLKNIIIF